MTGYDDSKVPNSLWRATATPGPDTPALAGETATDTVVVGAGFTGLRAAHLLAEAGQRVVVLDARGIGWGASGRTGGQVNPLPPVNGPDQVAKLVGSAYFDRLTQAILGSADELFEIIRTYQIDCLARQNGWLRVDHCPRAGIAARAVAKAWNKHGAGIEFLDGPELHRAVGSTAFQSGALIPKGGAIHPLSYARGLARAAIAAGASIHGDSPVVALARDQGNWQVQTPTGRLLAQSVLLCTNGYTDALWPGLAQSVIPLVSIQAATEPLSGAVVDEILPGGRTFADTRRGILYGRREPDGRFLLGCLGRLSEQADRAAFKEMRQEAERIFPALRGATWAYRWGGRLAITPDRLPHLHEPAPGLFAGLGYNGRGVALSNVMGRVLAERVLGKVPEEVAFPTSPIRAYPFHRFHEIGARARMLWMRYQDRREVARG